MSVQYKDYYRLLGVSRDASEKQIKDAYRRMARKWHPDRHQGDDKSTAEERFKEINEAYEVLSDAEKRRKYDQLGAYWRDGAEFTPPSGWGEQFQGWSTRRPGRGATPFSDFFEMLFGREFGGAGGAAPHPFGAADGEDIEAELDVELEESLRGGRRRLSIDTPAICTGCGGAGQLSDGRPCSGCRGAGEVAQRRQVDVTIPEGVAEGRRIRLSGQGRPGVGGGRNGDLLLKIRFRPHNRFRVLSGRDVESDLNVPSWDAALGGSAEAPTLDGPVSVKIPPGVESGTRLRLRGRGLPLGDGTRGDQYVRVLLTVPRDPDPTTRRLFTELRSHHAPSSSGGAGDDHVEGR